MSLLKYKIVIDVPIDSPGGEPPYDATVMAMNETTGGQVEFTERDGNAIRRFVNEAWERGRARN